MEKELLKRLWLVVMIGGVAGLFAGCATEFHRDYRAPEVQLDQLGQVAILPFVNLSDYPQAGKIVTELMSTELYNSERFDILPEAKVKEILQKEQYSEEKIEDLAYLQKIGESLAVDNLIIGSVSEYRYKRGLGEEPVVGINLRMVKVKSGKILWAASHSATGRNFAFSHDSLNRLAQSICAEIVREFVR